MHVGINTTDGISLGSHRHISALIKGPPLCAYAGCQLENGISEKLFFLVITSVKSQGVLYADDKLVLHELVSL